MAVMDDLIPWISLKDVQGIGNLLYKRLIDRFQSPEAVFASSFEELAAVEGISEKVARAIHRYRTPDWVYLPLQIGVAWWCWGILGSET